MHEPFSQSSPAFADPEISGRVTGGSCFLRQSSPPADHYQRDGLVQVAIGASSWRLSSCPEGGSRLRLISKGRRRRGSQSQTGENGQEPTENLTAIRLAFVGWKNAVTLSATRKGFDRLGQCPAHPIHGVGIREDPGRIAAARIGNRHKPPGFIEGPLGLRALPVRAFSRSTRSLNR